ncbi:MAG TPA: hypothetical protein VD969_01710 [Symbiobacteriaceae bacterium]|nr:hypothetical protein [Symbiobacteriaceae bacterium]
MDDEFFFPQNVRTSYRLWILGPRHLKRLSLAPLIAVLAGLALFKVSLFLAAVVAGLLASVYAALFCIPLLADEQTLSDVGWEVYRHRRHQTAFAHAREVSGHRSVAELEQ